VRINGEGEVVPEGPAEWLAGAQVRTSEVVDKARALTARFRELPESGLVLVPSREARELRAAVAELEAWVCVKPREMR
jgi:hypothetical protein